MPEARASRKRQIQVTPGPFSDAAASSAYLTANRVQAGSLSSFFQGFPSLFLLQRFSRAFTEGFAIFSASRDGDSAERHRSAGGRAFNAEPLLSS
jgi:hypothetical protein